MSAEERTPAVRDERGAPERPEAGPSPSVDSLPEASTEGEPRERATAAPRRRRLASLAVLAAGGLVAAYLASQGPREQHVRVVLGSAAPEVTEVGMQYIAEGGELAREAQFAYAHGAAPRIVAHHPKLPNGEYRLHIDVDARGGRRAIQRRVTLEGGSTQIDVSSALEQDDESAATRATP